MTNSKTTICIAGKNNIAVDVMEYCLHKYKNDKKINIVCVLNKTDNGINTWQKSLKWFCEKENVQIVTLEEIYEIKNLLFLSLEFDRLIKTSKFKTDKLFNIHFSLLPEYKGMYTSSLPILHGKKRTGVTLHMIRDGIDTGEIIAQKEIKIKDDTALDLYRKLIKYGTELAVSHISDLLNTKYTYTAQQNENSTYFSIKSIDYSNLNMDVNSTANQIKNQVRAFAFRPYQLLTFNNIGIIECKITDNVSIKKPGTILSESQTAYLISTIDYDVILYKDVLKELFYEIKQFNNEKAKQLCECNKIINEQDNHGWSSLSVAVYYANVEMIKFLLKNGANVNVINNNGTNLLMYAKDAYINTHNNLPYKLIRECGITEEQKDYNGQNLLYYISQNNLTLDELIK